MHLTQPCRIPLQGALLQGAPPGPQLDGILTLPASALGVSALALAQHHTQHCLNRVEQPSQRHVESAIHSVFSQSFVSVVSAVTSLLLLLILFIWVFFLFLDEHG